MPRIRYDDRVRCACGRKVSPDVMLDVTALPDVLRDGRDAICDGCREQWHRMGVVTRAELAMLLGAPAARVAAIAAKHGEPPRRLRAALLAALTIRAAQEPRAIRAGRRLTLAAPLTTRADVGAGDSVTPPTPTP